MYNMLQIVTNVCLQVRAATRVGFGPFNSQQITLNSGIESVRAGDNNHNYVFRVETGGDACRKVPK